MQEAGYKSQPISIGFRSKLYTYGWEFEVMPNNDYIAYNTHWRKSELTTKQTDNVQLSRNDCNQEYCAEFLYLFTREFSRQKQTLTQ